MFVDWYHPVPFVDLCGEEYGFRFFESGGIKYIDVMRGSVSFSIPIEDKQIKWGSFGYRDFEDSMSPEARQYAERLVRLQAFL